MYDVFPTKFPYKIFLNLACIPHTKMHIARFKMTNVFYILVFIALAHPV